MKTQTITDNNVDNCIDGAKHELVPARQRGRRVRFRCNVCTRLTGWQKQTGTITEKEPVGQITKQSRIDNLMDHSLSGLKAMAKQLSLTGYSGLKKADLAKFIVDNT